MSKFRKPHGQYVRATADWFSDRRMALAGNQVAVAGQSSTVSLYNDSTDGSTLHVVGLLGVSTTANNGINVLLTKGTVGTPNGADPVPLGPFPVMLAGHVYTGATLTPPGDPAIWALAFLQTQDAWPYEFAICILPPGWSLVGKSSIINATISMYFQWLVMGHNQGYY